MNNETVSDTSVSQDISPNPSSSPIASVEPSAKKNQLFLWGIGLVALFGFIGSLFLWQKLNHIQEQLAKQSADTGSQAVEAKSLAKLAYELSLETAARQALAETKMAEVALQRSQLEELIQSLSRSRDENLVVDIEASLRLAQQQAQLTGSVQPLIAALKTAEQRLTKVAQPRLAPVLRAMNRDIDRIKVATIADTPSLLGKIDELISWINTAPLLNAVDQKSKPSANTNPSANANWMSSTNAQAWDRLWDDIWSELKGLVRVSRIDKPEASLLAPEQSYFVRENLKLKLLNARLGLLARQYESSRSDLLQAERELSNFFETQSRKGLAAKQLLVQIQQQIKHTEIPNLDDTLGALTTASAGR